MAIDYTTDATTYGLVGLLQLNAAVPINQQRFTNNDLIALLNQELNNNIVPIIKKTNNELFVVPYDLQLVQGQASYPMPYQCIGETLRLVTQVYTADTTGQTEYQIRRLTQEEISAYWNGLTLIPVANNQIYGFYIEGNNIIFYPAPTANALPQKVRLRYFRQPNNLVSTSVCGQIASIDPVHNTVTFVNPVPTDWTVGMNITVIGNQPPFITEIESTPILSISSPTVGIASVQGLNIGDWMCYTGDSPIPQIPYSCFGTLVQATIVKLMASIKDVVGMQLAQGVLKNLEPEMLASIEPRDSGQPRKRVSNGNGLFDCNRRASWRTWW